MFIFLVVLLYVIINELIFLESESKILKLCVLLIRLLKKVLRLCRRNIIYWKGIIEYFFIVWVFVGLVGFKFVNKEGKSIMVDSYVGVFFGIFFINILRIWVLKF